jgi:hypothetical protein
MWYGDNLPAWKRTEYRPYVQDYLSSGDTPIYLACFLSYKARLYPDGKGWLSSMGKCHNTNAFSTDVKSLSSVSAE